jgi:UDP-N-acetylmuramoyl-L-alanyl-D-glutamate--2,6-diaminopimelate ligase
LEKIADAVENFGGVSGRMEVVSESPLVIVDFAHTPDGMEQVLMPLKRKKF